MADRSELWVSLSGDGGRSWSEPRFLLANALQPAFDTPFRNHQCSYMDLFIDRGTVHLFIPHRWQQVTYLRFPENLLPELPASAVFCIQVKTFHRDAKPASSVRLVVGPSTAEWWAAR